MSFAGRYIQTAENIIAAYDGSIPLHHFLKQFFAADKKYGSKDRKTIAHACYCYYRLGRSMDGLPINEKIKTGIFLCNDQPGIWSVLFDEDFLNNWTNDLNQRLSFLQAKAASTDIFPFKEEISNGIDQNEFALSHLLQPDLFLRIRPGKKDKVLRKLSADGFEYNHCGIDCISLPNTSKIDKVLSIDKDVVVQDLSSQRVSEFMSAITSQELVIKTWDCCAASGGKSILAYDLLGNIDLTVSDIRPSIIQNLKKRFELAGLRNYRSFIADLSANYQPSDNNRFDLIICDAPCSGSGTWGRTPEQLVFFKEEQIVYYSNLQKRIATNVSSSLAAGGWLLYITCSVFEKENEGVVKHIMGNTSLKLVRMEYLKGYDKKADTMFAALFTASAP